MIYVEVRYLLIKLNVIILHAATIRNFYNSNMNNIYNNNNKNNLFSIKNETR